MNTELGGDISDETEGKSNDFSTTWSFTTSKDPWTAGPMSDVSAIFCSFSPSMSTDHYISLLIQLLLSNECNHDLRQVFVVPNLYVKFEEVYELVWNNTICEPILNQTLKDENKNPFPSQLIFSVNSPTSKPALSFFSRYHIEYVKLPDLNDAVQKQQAIVQAMEDEPVCCLDEGTPCLPGRRKKFCTDEEKEEEKEDLQSIIDGRDAWADNLLLEPEGKESLGNWMEGFGSTGMHKEEELKLGVAEVESGLVDPDLIDSSIQLINEYAKEDDAAKEGLATSQRIQIAGKFFFQFW